MGPWYDTAITPELARDPRMLDRIDMRHPLPAALPEGGHMITWLAVVLVLAVAGVAVGTAPTPEPQPVALAGDYSSRP